MPRLGLCKPHSGSFATWLLARPCPWEAPVGDWPVEGRGMCSGRSIPSAAAESASPGVTLLWPDCGCQMPTAQDAPQALPCPPGAVPWPHEAPPRKIPVISSLPVCCLNSRGDGCLLHSYMSLGYLRVHFLARSASLHSCNKFPILISSLRFLEWLLFADWTLHW